MANREVTEVTVYSFASIGSTLAAVVGLVQTLIDPNDAWVPLGALIGLVTMSVLTTVKVVRLLDGFRGQIERAERQRKVLAEKLGLELED